MGHFGKHKRKGKSAEDIPNSPKASAENLPEQPGQQPTEPPNNLYEGPRGSQESEDKINRIQKQTDEVTHVMQGNVDNMLQRGENMQDLSKQTETLQASSEQFAKKAADVKKKLWWKNVKTGIIVAAIILCIIIGIVIYFVVSSKKKNKGG